jgi:hypothetical protein
MEPIAVNNFASLIFFYSFPRGSTVLEGPWRLTYRRFLELFRQMVGLLGRVISPSQGLYLHRKTQHRKTRTNIPCHERDSKPRSQQPTGQDPRLRPHSHGDRLLLYYRNHYSHGRRTTRFIFGEI